MPRRSNGCETCKRRKVKCDEAKPTCERCVRQGYQCEGYIEQQQVRRRSPAFRDQTERVAARAEASYARGASARSSALPRRLSQIQPDEHPTLLLSSGPRTESLPSMSSMDTSRERRNQLLSIFVDAYLPHTATSIAPSHYSYMYILHDILGQHPAIPSAVDALCLYVAGKSHGDDEVVAKSKNIYGAALSRLAQNLERARLFAPTGTMAAIVLLAWCELNMGNSTNPNAWENHLIGASSLLESFEPAVWDTNEGRLFLQAVRYMLTCTGILKQKSVVFTQPRWHDLVSGGDEPDAWVALMNHATQIPGLLEETDSFLSSSSISSQIGDLMSRCFQLRSSMRDWYDKLESTSPPDSATLVPIGSYDWWESTPYDTAFPETFTFSNCRQCYLRLQYWFFLLTLSKNILRLYDSGYVLWETGFPSREAIEAEVLSCATNAARSTTTSFDPHTPPVSRFNAAFVIKLCGDTFHQYGIMDKFQWLKVMSERLEERGFCTPELMKLEQEAT